MDVAEHTRGRDLQAQLILQSNSIQTLQDQLTLSDVNAETRFEDLGTEMRQFQDRIILHPASRWYQGLADDHLLTWPDFTAALRLPFGPSEFDDLASALTKLLQTSTVLEYQATFEELSSRVPALTPPLLRSMSIYGLKPHLRREVLTRRPTDLHEALNLARLFEDQQNDLRASRPWLSRSPPPLSLLPATAAPPPLAAATSQG